MKHSVRLFGVFVAVLGSACGGGFSPVTDASAGDTPVDVVGDHAWSDTATPDASIADATPADAVADVSTVDVPTNLDAFSSDAPAVDAVDVVSVDAALDAGPTPCTDNTVCTARQYCSGTGCGTPGTCTNRPVACVPTTATVCGCDGTTYTDLCQAHLAGVRVAATGACAADGGIADGATQDVVTPTDTSGGCTDSSECATTEFCAIPSGAACGSVGACTPRPTTCPGFCVLQCGCDGMNYCNQCQANRAGVNLRPTGGSCGGGI